MTEQKNYEIKYTASKTRILLEVYFLRKMGLRPENKK